MMNQKQRKAPTAHARSSRPSLHKRAHSYNQNQSHGQGQSAAAKPNSVASRKEEVEVTYSDDAEEAGMASFLQFCTTCEKQISTPGNMLYCSTACRRRDSMRPPSIHTAQSPAATIPSPASYFSSSPPDIIPQRSPTVVRPASLTFSDYGASNSGSPSDERESEAARFLGQFYSQSYATDRSATRRPRVNRASTGTDLPSLTHTPSSSIGTVGSTASYRPLPPRYSASSRHTGTKSIDLVIPIFPNATASASEEHEDGSPQSSVRTLTSHHVAGSEGFSYERRKRNSSYNTPTGGNLKQLFSYNAMQAPPKGT